MICRHFAHSVTADRLCIAGKDCEESDIPCTNKRCTNKTAWKDAMLCYVCVERKQALTGQFNQSVAPWVEYAARLVKMRLASLTDGASNLQTKKFACSKPQFDAMRNHIAHQMLDSGVERLHGITPVYRMGGIGSTKSAWQFQLMSGLAVKRLMQTCFTEMGEMGSMRLYPEGHGVAIIPKMAFTLRLDQNYWGGIGAIGHAQIKFDLMGWSPNGTFRQANDVEYSELALQQMQIYMMHLVSEMKDSGRTLSKGQEAVLLRFTSGYEEEPDQEA